MKIVNSSARGTDSQTPIIPIQIGSSKILITIKTRVRQNEIIAEVLPSEKAVNIEEAKIFTPAKI